VRRYVARRVAALVATLLFVSALVFVVVRVLPGDPAALILGTEGSPETMERLRESMGLNRPLPVQFLEWLGGALRGDLGRSIQYDVPVGELIVSRLAVTLPLALLAAALMIAAAIPLGLYAATHHRRPGDYATMVLSQLGISIPQFWSGLLLILLFSVQLGWTPVSGRIAVKYYLEPVTGFLTIDALLSGEKGAFRSAVSHLILPMIVLGTNPLAIIARMTRSSMLEVLGEDYIRTARAKGLSNFRVVALHAFRNALIPVITVIGLQVGVLFTGAILTETIFSWPGVGKWLIEAINRRDYPVLQGGLLMLGVIVMTVNLLVDVAYGIINPRIRRST